MKQQFCRPNTYLKFILFISEDKNKIAEEENRIPSEINMANEDPGLFETVKSTLTSLQEVPCGEFLMVVFGGHLSELTNQHSPLVQSVKYVTENTNPENTLIVVTGTCQGQEAGKDTMININEDAMNDHNNVRSLEGCAVLPVFAKGAVPGYDY
ncbi:hypothetical protein NQ318_000615 [Aromia moschata]|uniref:Uncharacterized protein n=1 Tax=Aromia moschata TaxID=1265417 RepID=A0AAV8XQY8_9CUCU|nr:hypothetical protein NQ318_000615 [Aromia moschata]